jgi:hypothetical protein
MGDDFVAEIEVSLNGLKSEDIMVDIVVGLKENGNVKEVSMTKELERISGNGEKTLFRCVIPTTRTGTFDYAFRIYPVHPDLQHRQDFPLNKWV